MVMQVRERVCVRMCVREIVREKDALCKCICVCTRVCVIEREKTERVRNTYSTQVGANLKIEKMLVYL